MDHPGFPRIFFQNGLLIRIVNQVCLRNIHHFGGLFRLSFFFSFFFISVAWQQALWSPYRSGMVIFELNHRAGSGIAFDLFGSKSPESAQFWPQSRHNCLFGDFFLNFCIFWTLFHSNSSFLASGLANLGS